MRIFSYTVLGLSLALLVFSVRKATKWTPERVNRTLRNPANKLAYEHPLVTVLLLFSVTLSMIVVLGDIIGGPFPTMHKYLFSASFGLCGGLGSRMSWRKAKELDAANNHVHDSLASSAS